MGPNPQSPIPNPQLKNSLIIIYNNFYIKEIII